MKNTPIIALDFATKDEVMAFLAKFDTPLFVKVGMELFYQTGPTLLDVIKQQGHDIFLDLKLHDIPNTVGKAMEGLGRLNVDLVNVHAAGGSVMMQRAVEGLRRTNPDTKIIAVTQLTSTTEQQLHNEQKIDMLMEEAVCHYAKLAQDSGLDGVVCSPLEAAPITAHCGADFLKVTPGVRPANAAVNDQKRVTTPQQARALGSTHIVVGRPITQSDDPVASYQQITESWLGKW
ncbi:orotidine-5'-phosphate decarboxylase [Staphylococcus sp. IVB6214]|uniref:orotidine-5'-phosphate decarboxylase n=1 Tax=Staphylococcus sp. IVB6214 TaxID=2989766 RepID=UPI0021D04F3D|nr:orotidine-5'-phosphate decarboxylase [Staphylococcus sp. IVB6214]UXR83273.1 orotidine-5'-phosphate decarboxylase [Staphylococcus sp. IVB6214]